MIRSICISCPEPKTFATGGTLCNYVCKSQSFKGTHDNYVNHVTLCDALRQLSRKTNSYRAKCQKIDALALAAGEKLRDDSHGEGIGGLRPRHIDIGFRRPAVLPEAQSDVK
jgi:hypothetical protein